MTRSLLSPRHNAAWHLVYALLAQCCLAPAALWASTTPAAVEVEAYRPSTVPDRITLSISGDPATQMAVNWRTDSDQEALAQIAVSDGGPNQEGRALSLSGQTQALTTPDYTAYHHSVQFEELEPDTRYVYRVGNRFGTHVIWSEWAQFTTAKYGTGSKVSPFSFIYFGDAQNDLKSRWSRVIRQAYSDMPKANFMLHAGDLVDINDKDQEWGQWFYSGGWIYSGIPSVATPGNHEYGFGSGLTPMWRTHFTFPQNGPQNHQDDLNQTAYYFDYQGTRFISINSQAMSSSGADSQSIAQTQANWLEQVLRDNPSRWTIVFHHHPVFAASSGRGSHPWLNTLFKPLYEAHGVDLVLQGHDHSYARGNNLDTGKPAYKSEDGPVYVVSVSGPKMYTSNAHWADRAGSDTQLYQLINVSHNKIRYRAFSADGEPFDSFFIKKPRTKNPHCKKDRSGHQHNGAAQSGGHVHGAHHSH